MDRLNSKVVAELIGKRHDNLMRAIRTDIKNLEDPEKYYKEGSYTDGKGQERACYEISLDGCERLSKKLSEEEKEEFMISCSLRAGKPVREANTKPERVYTVKEVTEILGISERTFNRRVASGELKTEKREYKQVLTKERTVVTEAALEEYRKLQEDKNV